MRIKPSNVVLFAGAVGLTTYFKWLFTFESLAREF